MTKRSELVADFAIENQHMTYTEIAAATGVSASYVGQIRARMCRDELYLQKVVGLNLEAGNLAFILKEARKVDCSFREMLNAIINDARDEEE